MYNDIQTKKRIDINLKFLKIDPKENLEQLIKENDIYLNENAKKVSSEGILDLLDELFAQITNEIISGFA